MCLIDDLFVDRKIDGWCGHSKAVVAGEWKKRRRRRRSTAGEATIELYLLADDTGEMIRSCYSRAAFGRWVISPWGGKEMVAGI